MEDTGKLLSGKWKTLGELVSSRVEDTGEKFCVVEWKTQGKPFSGRWKTLGKLFSGRVGDTGNFLNVRLESCDFEAFGHQAIDVPLALHVK